MNKMKLLCVLSLFFLSNAFAQQKDRVLEVESQIKKDAINFISRYISSSKFIVEVDVKPLRRKSIAARNATALPFVDIDQNSFVDEWEDTSINIFTLYGRIREAQVKILLDKSVVLNNKRDFTETLLREINLLPSRDQVLFEDLNSGVIETEFSFNEYRIEILGVIAIGLFLFFGLALFDLFKKFVLKQESNSDASARPIEGGRVMAGSSDSGMGAARESGSSIFSANGGSIDGSSLIFNDQAKLEERIKEKLNILSSKDNFPSHQDLMALESLLSTDIDTFGYIVSTLDTASQKNLYCFGRKEAWFDGFTTIGKPNLDAISFLEMQIRDRDNTLNKEVSELLAIIWRLDFEAVRIFKNYDHKTVMQLIRRLPKNFSIPVARELYPGNWGELFSNINVEFNISDSVLKKIKAECLELKPLLSYKALVEFKDRKDLLKYLDRVDPQEEKDIYTVMGQGSGISMIRPPFYLIFEENLNRLKDFVPLFTIKDWAIGCVNVDYDKRDLVLANYDEKEKYYFSMHLKEYGNDEIYLPLIHNTRRKIAQKYFEYVERENIKLFEQIQQETDDEREVA